jgi:hypothetical protein
VTFANGRHLKPYPLRLPIAIANFASVYAARRQFRQPEPSADDVGHTFPLKITATCTPTMTPQAKTMM